MSTAEGGSIAAIGRVGRSWQLALLAVAFAASNYARTALSPLQEAVRTDLSLSDNQMALLQGPAMVLPLIIAAVPLGFLIDRYSRARLLVLFGGLTVIGSVLTAFAVSFAMLFAARCLVGLAAFMIPIAVLSLVADLYTPSQRGRAAMPVAVAEVFGASATFALGGVLLTTLSAAGNSWHAAMLGLTGPLVLASFSMLALHEPQRTGLELRKPSARESLAGLWRVRMTIAPLLIGKIMTTTIYGALLVWAAPALARHFALSADRVGAIMATSLLVSGVLGPVAGGLVADLCQRSGGPQRTMFALSGLALLSVPAGLFSLAPDVVSASLLLVVFMTLVSSIQVTEMTLTTVVIPNELRGACLSVLVAVGLTFGSGAAPMMVSVLSGAMGGADEIGRALALVSAAACSSAAVIFLVGKRYMPHEA